MSEKKKSKEELFLKKLYELSSAFGDPLSEIDRYEVGKEMGEHTKTIDHCVQMLTKNNFLKKHGESHVSLTQLGVAFVEENLA